jgi:quercetin dioxygenase-like cupin family protein
MSDREAASSWQIVTLPEVDRIELTTGVVGHPLIGQGAMLNLLDIEPDAGVPLHDHPHEQLGLVVSGELILTLDGTEHRLGPMDAYQLDGNLAHAARAGEDGCRVLDIFQPVREDYRALAEAAAR